MIKRLTMNILKLNSEFSSKNNKIKLGTNNERCIVENPGFVNTHQKRLSISRKRRFEDEKIKYKSIKYDPKK